MSSVEKIEPIEKIDNVMQKFNAYEARIEQLEQQLGEVHSSTLQVSVADMTRMYSNHLNTIDMSIGFAAIGVVFFGTVLMIIGWKAIQQMIKNLVNEKIGEEIKEAVEPLQEEQEEMQANFHFLLGNQHASEKKYKEAIEEYSKAIEADPKHVKAYVNRGNAKGELKQYEDAIKDYDKAIELDPSGTLAYFNKARVYCLMDKKPEEILKILKKAIELDSKYVKMAREDDDFASLRDNPEFRKLVGLDDK